MGEYAVHRKERIKIGTCESMYYLRYEDRFKVAHESGNVDPSREMNLFWRLPYPDEDSNGPGNYREYNRGLRLCKPASEHDQKRGHMMDDFICFDLGRRPGKLSLSHPSGLRVTVPCYHGERLPEESGGVSYGWNGKDWAYELAFLKNAATGVAPIVRCRHCGNLWSFDWVDVWEYIPEDIRSRFQSYAELEAGKAESVWNLQHEMKVKS